jgi:signal transduction histidine kinase
MRGLDGAPILVEDAVVLSDQVQSYIRRLGQELEAGRREIDAGWRRRRARAGLKGDDPRLAALAKINPGAHPGFLAEGRLRDFFETIEYNGRRLAKLEVSPAEVIASLREYEEALVPVLRRQFGRDASNYIWSLEHLYFCIMLTLNTAYFQVRDLEAQAFYDVFQDELESQSVEELLNRILDSLMRAFHAQGAGVLLLRADGQLELQASRGLQAGLARHFAGPTGQGFAGRVARSGRPRISLDTRRDPLVRSPEIRKAFRSLWAVPLQVKGKVTGVLHLNFAREYNCLPREMRLLEAIAERCALALEKAQLVEALAQREQQIRKLGEHMLKVEEEERRRISRELHDEVGQAMLVVRLYLEMLQQQLGAQVPGLVAKVAEAIGLIDGTIRDMRRLIAALSPSVLEQLGLAAALRQFVASFTRSFPIHVRLRLAPLGRLPQDTEIMLYRLVQECFTNVIKHSKAENVLLAVHRSNGRLHLRVEDDGIGFDLDQASQKRGSFGLTGMGERVALLGGRMDIDTRRREGTKIRIQIPI